MFSYLRYSKSRGTTLMGLIGLIGLIGCGGGLKTYPVEGKVQLTGGDSRHLAGSQVEAALESDPTVRASGTIQEDGTFKLETLHGGEILKGAPEGNYQVRLLLPDDDKAARKRAAQALDRRYLQFKTSGLSFQVPANGELTIKLTPNANGS